MGETVPVTIRRFVTDRAIGRCEYYLLHSEDSFTPHQIDHIVSCKHVGASSKNNLALACLRCNSWKGSDIAALGEEPYRIVPLFNPAGIDGKTTSS